METLPIPRPEELLPLPASPTEGLLAGLLAENTREAYRHDLRQFEAWLNETGASLGGLTPDHLTRYRSLLMTNYKPASVNRKLSVVRLLCEEAVNRGLLEKNPAARLKGLRMNGDFTPTPALSRGQVRRLLASIARESLPGKRDFALLSLLVRCGLRRAEAAALQVEDLQEDMGFSCLLVNGKGNKERRVKLPDEVQGHLRDWLQAAGIESGPLFRLLRKRGRGAEAAWEVGALAITPTAVWMIFRRRLHQAGIKGPFSPHSLRATFITLALAGGAGLHRVQYCAGHADPRTTERYDRQRDNLENSAVDYVKL